MPTYDYSCPNCGTVKEDVFHSIAELESPSEETLSEITCKCKPKGVRMILGYFNPPSIKTPTINRFLNNDRKKRNKKHFEKEVLPTLPDRDSKRHHIKKLGYKN